VRSGFAFKNYLYNPMKNCGWSIVLVMLMGACLEDAECLRTADNSVVISFKKLADGTTDTLYVYKIAGSGADSIFYEDKPTDLRDTLTSATLTVNPFESETLYTFYFEAEQKTLKLGYKTEASFISEECGAELVHYDLQVLETQFDSVRVTFNRLTTSKQTNIEIYH